MMKSLKSLILILALVIPVALFGQAKTGTTAMTFLKIDVTARANAMGGAFIGLADDASTLFYNPAGMIKLDQPEFTLSHTLYLAETQLSYAGLVIPLKEMNAAMGFQSTYWTSGDMDETRPDFPTGTGRTFQAYDLMLGASYAQMLTTKFYVGGTVKFLSEGLADEQVYNFAGDVGTYYDTQWRSLIFGMSIRNFGGTVKYVNEEADIPMTFQFGVSFEAYNDDVNKLTTLIEAGHPADNNEFIIFGLEYSFEDIFFLRFGRYINDRECSLTKSQENLDFDDNEDGSVFDYSDDGINWHGTSGGLGFKMEGFKFDYSIESYGYLGITHMMTLGYSF